MLEAPLFRGLKEEELAAFLFGETGCLRTFAGGDVVFRQGALCKSLYLLAAGRVKAEMTGGDGKAFTVEEINAPALLASAFLFATENRFPVRVEAVEECEVFVIGRDRFMEYMRLYPAMLHNFLTDISDRSVFLSRKVKDFALLDLKKRLLRYLETHESVHNQREVAQRLGVTRPSLARALAELNAEGKIPRRGQ